MGLNSLQSSVDEQEFPPMSNNHSHIPGSLKLAVFDKIVNRC